jgi:hypothetical protein
MKIIKQNRLDKSVNNVEKAQRRRGATAFVARIISLLWNLIEIYIERETPVIERCIQIEKQHE